MQWHIMPLFYKFVRWCLGVWVTRGHSRHNVGGITHQDQIGKLHKRELPYHVQLTLFVY
jgi:hypothetical protein